MPRLGDRLAELRREAGLTQEQLAEAAGLATVTVAKLEQGKHDSARDTTIAALAQALGVAKHLLVGTTGESAARHTNHTDDIALVELRRAFEPPVGLGDVPGVDATIVDQVPGLEEIAGEVARLDHAYHADDYAMVLDSLPLLLAQTRAAVVGASPEDEVGATGLMVQAYDRAATMLTQLRHLDLAHRALTDAIAAARSTGNVMAGASAVTTMCWVLTRQARPLEAEALAVATADAIKPDFGPRADSVVLRSWGWLMIEASCSAARDNRGDDAEVFLAAAAAAAARVGPWRPDSVAAHRGPKPSLYIAGFNATAVEMARVEAAAITGDAARAVELARGVHVPDRWLTDNQHRHLLFVASSYARLGEDEQAAAILRRLGAQAPVWLLHQRSAVDIVENLRPRWRGGANDLAELSTLVGLAD